MTPHDPPCALCGVKLSEHTEKFCEICGYSHVYCEAAKELQGASHERRQG